MTTTLEKLWAEATIYVGDHSNSTTLLNAIEAARKEILAGLKPDRSAAPVILRLAGAAREAMRYLPHDRREKLAHEVELAERAVEGA